MTRPVLAWHFAPADMHCQHDGRRICVGETLTVEPPVRLCEHGLHGSVRVLDALCYAPQATRLCRVRIGGEVVRGSDKIAGTRRTVVWALTARQTDRALREFACQVAERALREHGVTDPRSHEAIRVARLHAAGKATDAELAAASAAARDAASAAARDAASAAARDAAMDAASAAARDAAMDAAMDAASAAARDAAMDAARAAQNRMLTRLATAAHRGNR